METDGNSSTTRRITRDQTENPNNAGPGASGTIQISSGKTRSSKRKSPEPRTVEVTDKAINIPSVVRIKVKGKYCQAQEENSDSDFETQVERQRKEVVEESRVRNKDTDSMILRLEGGYIVINEMTIHEILKVPIGGQDLSSMETTDEGAELASIWKHQYKKESPRPSDVIKAIQSTTDAGLMFKLNFLVLFVNSMAECSRMGCCAVNFLHRLKNMDMVSSINWSGYIFDCLKRIWANNENQTNDPPLRKWTMDQLRKRQQCAIKGGGFQRALMRGPGQTSNVDHENTNKDPHSPVDGEEDEDTIKRAYNMDLNAKFELLMRTKVDAQNLIMKAKERFPSDTLFDRYEDELVILFNENEFKGSGKTKQQTTLERCKEAGSSKQGIHEDNTIILCTPTKLNFESIESLDALSPLSPYWYSQTTYGIIDAQIEEKSAGREPTNKEGTGHDHKTSKAPEPNSNGSPTNLHIVAVSDPDQQPVPISQYGLIFQYLASTSE
ncbi:hypothetical protein L6452_05402 [Arctium lappa]|uniref:Uncharacterized protein n=1 Tax=Arctium lappa TaxID=4217 RepID=A0ACB9EG11_ARCLA|nr:hypothetical protein L6452_05402 [Arctium lappa]